MSRGSKTLKRIDRYLGIPLLAAASLLPRRPSFERTAVRRIGFLKTAAIGDTLLLAGLLRDTRAHFRGAQIVLIAGADNVQAAALLPDDPDETIVISPKNPLAAIKSVRAARLDLIVDFGSWPRFDALVAALSGARWRAGFATSNQHRHFAYDQRIRHDAALHERQNYERLLTSLGVDVTALPLLPAKIPISRDRLPARPFAVFHPWAGGYLAESREWAPERWVELGQKLNARGLDVMITGAPSEAAKSEQLAARLREAGVKATTGAGLFKLTELPALFTASEVVVAVNTGTMHLAALAGARTVGLHGPTSVSRWGPLGPHTASVTSDLPGCAYLNLGFEYDGQRLDCMTGVHVDAVVQAIESLVAISR